MVTHTWYDPTNIGVHIHIKGMSTLLRIGRLLYGVRTSARGTAGVGRWKSAWRPRWREIGTESEGRLLKNTADGEAVGPQNENHEESFSETIRSSNLVKIGSPSGKKVEADVIAVVGRNLYVDFGHKFHAVVPVPEANPEMYRKGTRVIVRVRDLELTSHFLGDSKDTSLLEAEVDLLGLA